MEAKNVVETFEKIPEDGIKNFSRKPVTYFHKIKFEKIPEDGSKKSSRNIRKMF
jgi:hypothetical protein